MTTNYGEDRLKFSNSLSLLPIRDIVVYPFMILPLFVGRESSILAIEDSLENNNRMIFLASQKDITVESPEPADIYEIGTIAMIMRLRKLPDGRNKILIQGLSKARIINYSKMSPHYTVDIEQIENISLSFDDPNVEALSRSTKAQLEKIIAKGRVLSPDLLMVLEDINDPGRLADLIASNLNLKVSDAQAILETIDPIERLHRINQLLSRELEVLSIQNKIRIVAKDEMMKNQKENFLREQMRAIKSELKDDYLDNPGDEFSELRQKVLNCQMPLNCEQETLRQLSRLERMHPESSEANIMRSYLDCILELPWSISSEESIDLAQAIKILDEDHFELKKVKERILEYLAVRKLKGSALKGPILCLIGPPGVGKTSLGKSVARAIGREFVRFSLGGVKDEAEIRGHRRTYVGAMPGRFIQALQHAGTNNPLIMLDEVDKLGSDFRGDPSSALLEVLDPEQNHTFRDHYVNMPFDLSKTMFIATANTIDKIPPALKDRLEILQLTGYTPEEKLLISKKFLINKQIEENGINKENIQFQDDGLTHIIKHFTLEPGLRTLERQIGALCRKVAKKVASNDNSSNVINPRQVEKMLGPPQYNRDVEHNNHEIGVATGLAWTSVGGETLQIEATKMKGHGLTLTGQIGEVMKESAQAAIGHIRSKAASFVIDDDFFNQHEIHIHAPAGATPKDGPSAGITIATAIISLITNIPVNKNVAMTGEITLTGKILPVGGIREKSLAAMRHGITTIILPYQNKKDLDEIPPEYKSKVSFICVKNIDEVLQAALYNSKKNPAKKKIIKKKKTKFPSNVAA